jgi:2-methylfumaryl-CoA isomerase
VLPAWDGMTGFLAALAILAAVRHRRLHGEGQLVELSLSDVGLAMAGHLGLIGEAVLEAEPRGRFGYDVYGTFGRDFGTRDGTPWDGAGADRQAVGQPRRSDWAS